MHRVWLYVDARKAMVAMLDLADRQFSQSAAGGLRQPA